MQIRTDLHIHTVASTHAYSTVTECAQSAQRQRLELIAVTDHGPGTPDGAHLWHFENMGILPRSICGVIVLRGIECSIIDDCGHLDAPEALLAKLDLVIASLHQCEGCWRPQTDEEHTRGMLALMEHPYVDIIGHVGRHKHSIDYEAIVKKAKAYGKIMELNAASFEKGEQILKNCTQVMRLCKQYAVPVAVNSDSHFCELIGRYDAVLRQLEALDFPEELIMNLTKERVLDYLRHKKNIII